jgi:hypothetical protein
MPPAAPDSLPAETYAALVAYMLSINGVEPGTEPLPVSGDPALEGMTIE